MRDENDIPAGGSGKVNRMIEPVAASIVGLGLGVLSLIFCWLPVIGLLCGIIGITVACVGFMKQRSGFAIGGLVASIVGTLLSVGFAIVEFLGFIHFVD